MVIKDQKYLSLNVLDQSCQEPHQYFRGHRLPIKHEADFSLVGYRRNHICAASPCAETNNRCFFYWDKASGVICLIVYARLIAPVNLCFFLLCFGGYLRVTFVKPFPQLFRVLFIGSLR